MMKKLLIISATLLFVACSDGNDNNTGQPAVQLSREESYAASIRGTKTDQEAAYNAELQRSEKLKDCVYEYVDCRDCRKVLYMVRCPASTTTTTSQDGKTEAAVTVDSPTP